MTARRTKPAPASPPEGTRTFEHPGGRYDLVPHANGCDVLLVEWESDAPNRFATSWLSADPGVEAFMRNFGNRATELPPGTPLMELVRPLVARRLREAREPIDLASLLPTP